jgi:hypothetical protein
MASALFDINADGEDQGYEGSSGEVLELQLRQQPPIGVNTVVFQVFSAAGFDPENGIAANPPRASKDAPELDIVGATTGQTVSPTSVDGSVEITLPIGVTPHSWIVRCIVNGGTRSLPNGQVVADPSLIHERGIYIPSAFGARMVVCTETRQFSDGGWADALADLQGSLGLLRRTVLQGAGTHEFSVYARAFSFTIQGASGAGGGAASTGPDVCSVGGGGGAGESVDNFIGIDPSIAQSLDYSCAAGGVPAAGLAGGNASASTLTYNGFVYTANGGQGGSVVTVTDSDGPSTNIPRIGFGRGGLGGTGGPGAGGTAFDGAPGGFGVAYAETNQGTAIGGNGGASRFGGAGRGGYIPGNTGNSSGSAGTNGSGGGGSVQHGGFGPPALPGGAGSDAFIVLLEYGSESIV